MAKEAGYNREDCDEGSGNIRRFDLISGRTTDQSHQGGQCQRRNEDTSTVDSQRAKPLAEIVAPGSKDEPLITEKSYCDVDKAGSKTGNDVRICGDYRRQPAVHQEKAGVAECRIPAADQQVAQELAWRDMACDAAPRFPYS